jgi:hypothetical protein
VWNRIEVRLFLRLVEVPSTIVAVMMILVVTSVSVGAAPGAVTARDVVACDEAIDFLDKAPTKRRVLFDRVALPRLIAQRPNYEPSEFRPLPYFAKDGIVVRAGRTPVDLIVPTAWRSRLALGWGHRGPQQASHVRVPGCRPTRYAKWFAFAGGYYVRKPACVPLIVRVGAKSQRIRIRIGRNC